MEEKIRNYVNKKYGFNFVETKTIIDDCRYHADGDDENKKCMLEIKTTSQIHENERDNKMYIVQLLKGMMMKGYKQGKLFIYNRPEDFSEEFDEKRLIHFNIQIENYDEWCEEINKAVEQFRIDLARIKENPFLTEEDLLPNDLITAANEVVALESQLKTFKELEKQEKDLKAKLKNIMEKYNIKTWETPNGIKFTLVPDGEDKEVLMFNEEKFKEENEKTYNTYLEPIIQKGRAGYVKITLSKREV